MARFDATDAECVVTTFAEGLLSPLGHDLALGVEDFHIEVDLETGSAGSAEAVGSVASVTATFGAGSLRCLHALKRGRPAPGVLSERDRRQVDEHTARDVLDARRHPEIVFRSTAVRGSAGAWTVEGRLTIKGVERPIRVPVRREGDRYVAEVRLHQPDFGIRPFKAVMGTLKVKPDVVVRVSVPAVG